MVGVNKTRSSGVWEVGKVDDTLCTGVVRGLNRKQIIIDKDGDESGQGLYNNFYERERGRRKSDDGRDLFQRQKNRQYHQANHGDVKQKKRIRGQIINK